MLARQKILKSFFFFFALMWVVSADAVIYKWQDENGKSHFTDNPAKVPEAFRKKPFLNGASTQKEIFKPKKNAVPPDAGGVLDKKEDDENKNKAGDKPAGLTETQRSAVEAAAGFLKADITRYESIYTYPPSRSKFRALKQAVADATSQKQALLDQVSQHDLPLLESIAAFLTTSIAEDEKSQKIMPTTITSTRQTQALMNRLKGEAEQEKQLLEKLTVALDSQK